MNRECSLMGFNINEKSLQSIIAECIEQPAHHTKVMACANPHSLVAANNDAQFERALRDSDYLIADGVGIMYALKMLRKPLVPRITGHDFFSAINDAFSMDDVQTSLGRKARVFFFGSSTHVLDRLSAEMAELYPSLELCGTLSPPFGDWSEKENQAMIDDINRAAPDILWVGMTAPKQEKWLFENVGQLNAKVAGSIGAVFDFTAKTYPRAPEWACRWGIEWLVRLAKEPKRLWKRTFLSAPIFFYLVLRNK